MNSTKTSSLDEVGREGLDAQSDGVRRRADRLSDRNIQRTARYKPLSATKSNREELQILHRGHQVALVRRRLQINDEIYYYDFHNLIIQSYDISAPYNLIFNGNKVAIKGNQLDILTRVFTDDQANLNIAYSHARNIDVVDTNGVNFNGLATAYAPDWVIETGYTHNMPLGSATLRAAHRLAIRKQVVGGLCAQQGHRGKLRRTRAMPR